MNLILPSIMQSIKPFNCGNIAVGIKGYEVRKTKPNISTPFKSYIYCTQPRGYFNVSAALRTASDYLYMLENGTTKFGDGLEDYDKRVKVLNGKVFCEYICDEIQEWVFDNETNSYDISDDDLALTCLTQEQLWEYGKGKTLYGYHITNLKIYDEPKELSEFEIIDKEFLKECPYRIRVYNNPNYTNGALLKVFYVCNNGFKPSFCRGQCGGATKPLTRPPQSWCYVEEV